MINNFSGTKKNSFKLRGSLMNKFGMEKVIFWLSGKDLTFL